MNFDSTRIWLNSLHEGCVLRSQRWFTSSHAWMDDFTGVVATSHVAHSLHPPSSINARKAFLQNIPIRPMKISALLLASFLALPKSLSASEAEGTLRGTERSLTICDNDAVGGGQDSGCTSNNKFCAALNGDQIVNRFAGDVCYKCLRVLDSSTSADYGCSAGAPICVADPNKGGQQCRGAAPTTPTTPSTVFVMPLK
jgi:hypothetical protein